MKNIHLIPTDKPSRLYSKNGNHKLANITMGMDWYISLAGYKPYNIYITSDEKPKEADNSWCIYDNQIILNDEYCQATLKDCEKIILTTDQSLIQDGVQAIDDDFLEWFVKNPSCEFVKTHIVKLCTNCGQQYCDNRDCRGYEDEPRYVISYPENTTQRIITYCDGYEVNTEKIIIPKEEPKQETIEEAAERSFRNEQVIELLEYVWSNYYDTGDHWHQEPDKDKKLMKKEFVPYKQALDLKELGFDEPCLAFYFAGGIRFKEYKDSKNKNSAFYNTTTCSIPTFSQAFRWFRKKHNLVIEPCVPFQRPYLTEDDHFEILEFGYRIWSFDPYRGGLRDKIEWSGGDDTDEIEAEAECLKKLIEICKKN